jgi:ATP-dependent DNA ligase
MKQGSAIDFIEPMMALQLQELPTGDWRYEMKFDGYRARLQGGQRASSPLAQPNDV